MGQQFEEAQAVLIQLTRLQQHGAETPERPAAGQGQSEVGGGQQNDDALRVAERFGPALLDGAKNGRQG
jgi:hypothetical protein